MSNKFLGILALMGSPWLFIGTYMESRNPHLSDSWFTGVWGILFISGWICAAIVLKRIKVAGRGAFGRTILLLLLISLCVANVSNVIQIFIERDKPSYFILFDLFWPLSNVIMLIAGITVIAVKGLPGWERYIPLAAGLWFPFAMLSSFTGINILSFFFGGVNSALAWGLLAIVIITTRKEPVMSNPGS